MPNSIASIILCIMFAISVAVLTLTSVFNKLYKNWWIYIIGLIFIIGSIMGGICTAEDNAILKKFINKKENKLVLRYKIESERLERLRVLYYVKK